MCMHSSLITHPKSYIQISKSQFTHNSSKIIPLDTQIWLHFYMEQGACDMNFLLYALHSARFGMLKITQFHCSVIYAFCFVIIFQQMVLKLSLSLSLFQQELVGSASFAATPPIKPAKLDEFLQGLPVSSYCVSCYNSMSYFGSSLDCIDYRIDWSFEKM